MKRLIFSICLVACCSIFGCQASHEEQESRRAPRSSSGKVIEQVKSVTQAADSHHRAIEEQVGE